MGSVILLYSWYSTQEQHNKYQSLETASSAYTEVTSMNLKKERNGQINRETENRGLFDKRKNSLRNHERSVMSPLKSRIYA